MGKISYKITLDEEDTLASMTPDDKISNAKKPGTITVTASTDGGTKYAAGKIGVYDVTFTIQDPEPTLLSFTNPDNRVMGRKISLAPTIPDAYSKEDMGALAYTIDNSAIQGMTSDDDQGVIDVDTEGRVTYLNQIGNVKVIVSIAGGEMYSAGQSW